MIDFDTLDKSKTYLAIQYGEGLISKKIRKYSKQNAPNSKKFRRAFDEYENKLNTGVLYTNGFKYKPKYINDYKKIMTDVETAVNLIKILGGDPSSIAS